MEPNAAVRSRLTHSLEVSQLGRYIADEIGQRLVARSALEPEQRSALVNFVETACLMHDIGNPPFGHFGEAAVQKWFGDNGKNCAKKAVELRDGDIGALDPRLVDALADFKEFDGNPQALRIVCRLQWNTDEFGLNLTATTLASFLKYARCAGQPNNGERFCRKAGYFRSEQEIVKKVRDIFEYTAPQRFPLAYIMEAADDIAYCVSDLEDSIEKGLVQEADAVSEIRGQFAAKQFDASDQCAASIQQTLDNICKRCRENGDPYTYTDFRTSLNRTIVKFVADRYVERHAELMRGQLDSLVPSESACDAILEILKDYCRNHVYNHESIQRVELAGYTAIRGLLDHFQPLLECSRERFRRALDNGRVDERGVAILIEPKFLALFPERYIKVYRHATKHLDNSELSGFSEWSARAHLVVDFVAGMTDDFAMTTYRTLSGMRL